MKSLLINFLLAATIFINPLHAQISILHKSAIPDGKTLNTETIQNAIVEISEKGGGTLTFPPGEYLKTTKASSGKSPII
ncbi:MAG: hypothetical protein ACOCUP_01415 [bacterium]